MARFVLVHGSWLGAWCWREITFCLAAMGHEAAAIDLPGHGADRASPETVTLRDYADRIIEAVHAKDDHPILVGHSMGGAFSQAAEAVPDRLRALVYIAALLPLDGATMMQCVNGDPEFQAQILWSADRRTARISPEGAKNFLYPQSPPATAEWASSLLTPEPVAPFETPMRLTKANFGRVPRYYIECLRDRIVPPALQRTMRTSFSFQGIYSIDTDHSPFFSAPDHLAAILDHIAEAA